MNPAWVALLTAGVSLLIAYLTRRWNVFDKVQAGTSAERREAAVADAQVAVREIDHTERFIETLQAELDRLRERVENLEQEREAWRNERVVFEHERMELTGRVAVLEQKLQDAGIPPV